MAKNTISTTNGVLKLINASDLTDELMLQFVPESIEFTRGGRVEDVSIVGRNLPFYQFVNGDREVSLDLDFHTDTDDGQDVLNKVRWIEKMTYNETFEGGVQSLQIQFGEVFSDKRWIIKPPFTYTLFDFDAEKGYAPRRAKAKLTLCQEETAKPIKRSNFLSSF